MIDFVDNSLVAQVGGASAGPRAYLDTSGLAALGTYRAALEDRAAGLADQIAQLQAYAGSVLFGPELADGSNPESEICQRHGQISFSLRGGTGAGHCLVVGETGLSAREVPDKFGSVEREVACFPSCSVYSPAPSPPAPIVGGLCPYCQWSGGLVEQRGDAGCVASVSIWCPACWLTTAGEPAAYLVYAPTHPLLFFIAQIVILEALFRSRDLLRLVIAAVAILLRVLRTAAFRHAIATTQRSFFTHHGAHPPRPQPRHAAGLLSGRVFQLQVAA